MMTKIRIATLLLIFVQLSLGQTVPTIEDSIATYFKEIKTATKEHRQIWAMDLYGPILLVNPNTRQLFANFPDTAGTLKQVGAIYSGVLPNEMNIANTAVNWNGRRWAMIILPLPLDKQERINLLAHELFHVSQPLLGFQLFDPQNNHLDKMDGRIYLRLELEALKKAVQTTDENERKAHLTNALTFREYRYFLYSGADSTENLLELNEGLAEYTGSAASGRNNKESTEHFAQSLNTFMSNPTFVRSFAYQTIPVYGYLLENIRQEWNREITTKTNLTDYFIKALNISLPNEIKKTVDLVSNQYNGQIIISEEHARDEKTKKIISEYKSRFIEQPHFEIRFEQMNVSFDPRNIMPIEDKGTIYPNIRVTDNWGILTVRNGAFMSSDWGKISVTVPIKIDEKNIIGDGWTLELKDGYAVTKDESSGNYQLTKKQ
jgi:hypothetical protein